MRSLHLLTLASVLAAGGSGALADQPPAPPVISKPDDPATVRRAEAYYHVLRAGLALGQGRSAEVGREVQHALELDPTSAGLHAEAAGLLALAGRRTEAERVARRALEIDPAQPVAMRVLGEMLALRALGPSGDAASRDEAIRFYEKLARDPGADDQVLGLLARLKIQAGDTAGALEAARRYAARRAGDPSASRLLIELLVRTGKPDQALAEVAKALEGEPDADDLLPLAAELARQTGAWTTLEGISGRRLGADARDARARALHGEALLRLDRAREAVAELEIAVGQSPADPYPRLHLAMAYTAAGRLADAASLARGLAVEYPDNPAPKLILAEVLMRQGDPEAALVALAEALRASEGIEEGAMERRDEVRRRMASLLLSGRRPAEAARKLEELERPGDLDSLETRARVALASSDLRQARTTARAIRDLKQPGPAALIEGAAFAREDRVEKARERFDDAVKALGAAGWGQVAAAWREAGQEEQAEDALRRWLRADPRSPEARFRLGIFLERAGRFAEAEVELRESLRLGPNDAEVLNYLAYSLADRGERLEEALELVRKALALDPWNAAFLDSLGWVYYRLGRYEEAREPLERAAREFPRDPTVLEHLGDLYQKLGDRGRATDLWKRALEMGPEKPDAIKTKIAHAEASAAAPSPSPPR